MNQNSSHLLSRPRVSVLRRCAIAACMVVFAVFAFRAATGPVQARSNTLSASPSQQAIETVQLGQRVVGRNPLREQTQAVAVIDRATWRRIDLETDQGGVKYDLSFLRPLTWLETHGAVEGGTFHLVMPEIGIDGLAHVVRITECPAIEPDDGSGRSVVTGTMSHPAENVLSVVIDGEPEPLGVTTTHPMWSEDQLSFVVAGDLKVGERLRRENGTLTQVTRITPHTGPPVMVHNLEVDGEHVYCVSEGGLLAHNSCPTNIGPYSSKARDQVTPGIRELEGHYVNDLGVVQPWRAHYDEYGRLIGRTDFNAGNIAHGIPDTHHHLYEWGPGMNPAEVGSHLPGEFPQ